MKRLFFAIVVLVMLVGGASAYVIGTNGTSMFEVANFPTDPYHNAVYDNVTYIQVGNEVWAYDISPGTNLSAIKYNGFDGRIIGKYNIDAIAAGNGKLYTVDGNALEIYDLTSNKYAPTRLGNYSTTADNILLDGANNAFIGISGGFEYLDVSNPASVSVVGTGSGNTVSHMAYDGSNWLFTTHESGKHNNGDGVFTIWDVSNKAAPTEYANIDTQNWTKYPGYYEGQSNTTATTSISYYNNTVYLAKYSWALDAYDVTNKDSVTEIWSSYITSYDIAAVDTKILGNYLYVTSRYTGFSNYCQDKGGLVIYDVSSPIPVALDSECTKVGYSEDVATDGTTAIICAEKCGCRLYDVSTKTNIVHKVLLTIPSLVYGNPVKTTVGAKDILAVPGKDNGVWFYDVTEPEEANDVTNPITQYNVLFGRGEFVPGVGNYSSYQMGSNGGGAWILDLSGIETPNFQPAVGSDFSGGSNVVSFYMNNDRIYLHTLSNFKVLDNTNKIVGTPATLATIAHTTTPLSSDYTQMFPYHSNYLIVRNGSGFNVLDVSTDSPTIAYYFVAPHTPNSGCYYYDSNVDRLYYCAGYNTYSVNTTTTTSWTQNAGYGRLTSAIMSPAAVVSNGTDVYVGGNDGIYLYDFTYPDVLEIPRVDHAEGMGNVEPRGLAFYDGYLYAGGSKLTIYQTTPWVNVPPALPTVSWSAAPTSGSAPLQVQFTDSSTDSEADSGEPYAWLWDFGDGYTATSQNPLHVFTDIGTYDVTLKVWGEGGTNTSAAQTITVQLTGADFVANRTWNATPPLTVSFTRIPADEPDGTSYEWNFIDGNATVDATTEDATYTYLEPGTYTVRYKVINGSESATKTRTNYITVGGDICDTSLPFTPSHSATPYESSKNHTMAEIKADDACTYVDHADTMLSASTTFKAFPDHISYMSRGQVSWDTSSLGDITISSAYIDMRKYFQNDNMTTDASYLFMDVRPSNPASASIYDWDNSWGLQVSESKSYANTVSGSAGSHKQWNVTNTSMINKTGYTSVFFTTDMDISATIPWVGGESQYAKFYGSDATLYVNFTGQCNDELLAPVSSFTVYPLYGTAPLTVDFYDASTNNPTSWNWSFGDGTYNNSQNPTHLYSDAGTYTVNLTATNAAGSGSSEQTVTATPTAPVAAFSCTPTGGDNPLYVTCTDESANYPTSWSWTFGDGATSTLANPSHTYTASGLYDVSLQATNAGGSDTETKTGYIEVFVNGTDVYAPVAAFTCSPLTGVAPMNIDCTDESTNSPTSWLWEVSDGVETSTDANATLGIHSAGVWNVTLTVFNAAGSSTLTKTSYVTADAPELPPDTDFHADATYVTNGTMVLFTDDSTNFPNNWDWYMGANENKTSDDQNPVVVFAVSGNYSIRLWTSNAYGGDWENKTNFMQVIDAPAPAPTLNKFMQSADTGASTSIGMGWILAIGLIFGAVILILGVMFSGGSLEPEVLVGIIVVVAIVLCALFLTGFMSGFMSKVVI